MSAKKEIDRVTGWSVGLSVLEASTDLHNWTLISTNIAALASVAITDACATKFSRMFCTWVAVH